MNNTYTFKPFMILFLRNTKFIRTHDVLNGNLKQSFAIEILYL